MTKTLAQTYQVLDEIQHIRQRTGMYAGAVTEETVKRWIFNADTKKMERREVTTVPALVKVVSEILDNAIDESRRHPDVLDAIRVRFYEDGSIEITDNGAGIPVSVIPQVKFDGKGTPELTVDAFDKDLPNRMLINLHGEDFTVSENGKVIGTGQRNKLFKSKNASFTIKSDEPFVDGSTYSINFAYIAETVFSNLRAGSNFSDEEDQQLIGTNGVGATLTNILSTSFHVESCDGKKMFRQEFIKGMRERSEPKVTPDKRNYTKITFTLDWEFFGLTELNEDHKLHIMKKVVDAAAANNKVKFYINGERILTQKFGDYIAMYADDYYYDETEDWKVGVSESEGHEVISFVNSVETYMGGTHVTYVTNQIVDGLRDMIKKKFKADIAPSDIRNHMRIYISCNVNRPKFSSQTKENMISPVGSWKTSWSVPEKMLRKIFESEIIKSALDTARAKAEAERLKDLRKANKDQTKFDPSKLDKFSDAREQKERQKCILFLGEGDSAVKAVQGGRGNSPYIGSFDIGGVPLNVRDKEIERILGLDKRKEKEKEGKKVEPSKIQKILLAIGLQIGVPVTSLSQLRFGKLAIAADADVDGFHISGLIMNVFDKFWPELFTLGFVHILRTPVVMVRQKNKVIAEFFTEHDFTEWESGEGAKIRGWDHEYYKGLSQWETEEFAVFMENLDKYLFKVTVEDEEDIDSIDLAFNGQRADDRKVWLESAAANFEDFIMTAAA